MKKFFTTDILMKILSLLIAFILWIYLVVLLNPETELVVTDIPVSLSNHLALQKDDLVIMNEKINPVTIKLKGTRNMLSNVNKNNITAYVDLSGYNKQGTYSLPIHIRLPYEEISIMEKKPYNININIDKLISQEFKIQVQITGTPKADFSALSPVTSQSLLSVKGPSELVKSIDKAVVEQDISLAAEDIVQLQRIKLLNTNGDEITNKALVFAPEKIEVRTPIVKRKVVPVKPILQSGADNIEASVMDIMEVTIIGKESVIDPIIEIYTKPIKTEDLKEDTNITAELAVPNDVTILEKTTHVLVSLKVKK